MARSIVDFETVIYNAKCCAADLAYKGLKEEMFTKPSRFTTYKNVRYIMSLVNILNKHYASVYDVSPTYGATFEVYPTDVTSGDYAFAILTTSLLTLNGGGWRLPTVAEMLEIYNNQDAISGLINDFYWTANPGTVAFSYICVNPITGAQSELNDKNILRSRPVKNLPSPYNLPSCLTNKEIEDIIQETLELCDQCGCNSKYDVITKDI
jgi:hypothetical protein